MGFNSAFKGLIPVKSSWYRPNRRLGWPQKLPGKELLVQTEQETGMAPEASR